MKKPILLCILDGYGLREESHGNAIKLANTPNINYLLNNYPNTTLEASGEYVGLPDGQMGNSEVGHMNIGAGNIVYQSLTLINKSIKEKTFYENEKFLKAIKHVKDNNSNLHIMGLLSNGGVHSNIEHIKALLMLAKVNRVENVYLHAFMDGRDTDPTSGYNFLKEINEFMLNEQVGKLASIHGRYYAMDRDKNFDRLKLAYDVLVNNVGNSFSNYQDYILSQYSELKASKGESSDEFIIPAYNADLGVKISDNDAIINANFRPDRAIEISTILTNPSFYNIDYPKDIKNLYFVCMMKYADSVNGEIAFKLDDIDTPLGVYLANNGYHQLRIAETEKYAHVTFFLDGTKDYDGVKNEELKNCTRVLIPSPKVATYDLKPSMSAYEVCDALLNELDKDKHDVIILNFANCDMVGHTGVLDATIKAVETVDECVGKIYHKIKQLDGVMLVIADHGNADIVLDDDNKPFTAHTKNPVPFIITSHKYQIIEENGCLANIAPTILYLLNENCSEMKMKSLIK